MHPAAKKKRKRLEADVIAKAIAWRRARGVQAVLAAEDALVGAVTDLEYHEYQYGPLPEGER